MKIVPPIRDLDQRRKALRKANEIRVYRSQLKRDIAAGLVDPVRIVAEPHTEVVTMRVFDLLLAMPKVGRVKANKVLQRARVSPSKTIGGLSDRQRTEITNLLPRCYGQEQRVA